MKKLRLILAMTALLAGAAFITSCSSDKDEPPVTVSLGVNPGTVNFYADTEGGQEVDITGTAEGPFTVTPQATWISATESNKKITITVSGTFEGESRTGTIRVTGNGQEATITVNEYATETPVNRTLSARPTSITFEAVQDDYTEEVTVTAVNVPDWTVEVSSNATSWLTAVKDGDDKVIVTAGEYDGSTDRDGTVTIVSNMEGVNNVTIPVKQKKSIRVTLTRGAIAYLGSYRTTASTEFQLFLTNDAQNINFVVTGFADHVANAESLDISGTYSIAETIQPNTMLAGYLNNSTIYDSYVVYLNSQSQIEDGFLIESGTMTITKNGNSYTVNADVSGTNITGSSTANTVSFSGDMNVTDVTGPYEFNDIMGTYSGAGNPVMYEFWFEGYEGEKPEPGPSTWSPTTITQFVYNGQGYLRYEVRGWGDDIDLNNAAFYMNFEYGDIYIDTAGAIANFEGEPVYMAAIAMGPNDSLVLLNDQEISFEGNVISFTDTWSGQDTQGNTYTNAPISYGFFVRGETLSGPISEGYTNVRLTRTATPGSYSAAAAPQVAFSGNKSNIELCPVTGKLMVNGRYATLHHESKSNKFEAKTALKF